MIINERHNNLGSTSEGGINSYIKTRTWANMNGEERRQAMTLFSQDRTLFNQYWTEMQKTHNPGVVFDDATKTEIRLDAVGTTMRSGKLSGLSGSASSLSGYKPRRS